VISVSLLRFADSVRSTVVERQIPADLQMRRLRVLHCPAMVAGTLQTLARAERKLGIDSWVVAFSPSTYGYKPDEILWNADDQLLVMEAKRWALLYRALKHFDILHFNFGQSIMPERVLRAENSDEHFSLLWQMYKLYARVLELRDLPVLKKAGKGIVVTYQGDDARQGDFCRRNFETHHAFEVELGYYSPESDAHKRRKIDVFSRYADRIYALNPDVLHMLPYRAEFLPYSQIDLTDWQPIHDARSTNQTPVVVHAPTHRLGKGTRFILDAVSRLKSEGVALQFLLVEGVAQTEARRTFQRADLLIDQLLTGWYGGVAVEAMALGKPVICYIREDDLKFVPARMREDLPIINAMPGTIYEVLREWMTKRRHELPELGRRSRAYVEKWHDPLKVAAKLKHEYEAIMACG